MPNRNLIFTYPYDQNNFNPPAPVLEVFLTIPTPKLNGQIIKLPALIDSGADITVIPQQIIQQLQLKYVDEVLAGGYDDIKLKKTYVYSVKITFGNLGDFIIRVIASERNNVLIGRDILNRWSLLLEGPGKIFRIS